MFRMKRAIIVIEPTNCSIVALNMVDVIHLALSHFFFFVFFFCRLVYVCVYVNMCVYM